MNLLALFGGSKAGPGRRTRPAIDRRPATADPVATADPDPAGSTAEDERRTMYLFAVAYINSSYVVF